MTDAIRLYWGRFGHVSVLNVASDFVTHAHVEAHIIIWLEGTAGEMTIGRETVALGPGTAAGINQLIYVLGLRNPEEAIHPNPVDSALIVEWRALTVALLDQIAVLIRERRGLTIDEFPLARVLEGGTWAAGRLLARDKRPDASPPIAVVSDGTVF